MKYLVCCVLSLIVSGLALLTSGCGGGSTTTTPPTVSVALAGNGTVPPGGTEKITATVGNDPAGKGVAWSVTCATTPCGSVSPTTTASGVATTYTAPNIPQANSLAVTVTAVSVTDPSISNATTITVSGVAVAVNPASSTVNIGTTARFTATVNNDPTSKGVDWTVSCTPSPCGSVSPTHTASGAATTYTAPTTFPAGDLVVAVTATSSAANSDAGAATVTVPGTTVTVNPGSATIEATRTSQFTATVVNDPKSLGVDWTVSCTPSPCGSVSLPHTASATPTTYSAPTTAPESDLPVTLTATSDFNNAATSTAMITIPAYRRALSEQRADSGQPAFDVHRYGGE
jgi:hypothetical protein